MKTIRRTITRRDDRGFDGDLPDGVTLVSEDNGTALVEIPEAGKIPTLAKLISAGFSVGIPQAA